MLVLHVCENRDRCISKCKMSLDYVIMATSTTVNTADGSFIVEPALADLITTLNEAKEQNSTQFCLRFFSLNLSEPVVIFNRRDST